DPIGHRQQGEQQAGQHRPQQAGGLCAGQLEMGSDQHQSGTDQQQGQPFHAANALAEQQSLQQHGKGRKAGEAQGGHRHAGQFHRVEESQPVSAQQQAAAGQQQQLPQPRSAITPGQGQQA